MEKCLVGPHAMLHKHLEQNLVDVGESVEVLVSFGTAGVHKGQQKGIVGRVIYWFFNNAVLVETGHRLNGIGHQPVGFLQDGITHCKLFLHIRSGMTF